jgi:divalent metal cation (Fe/Co/Zn/Cd) transporter
MVAIGVAVNIVWTGFRIVRESVIGLMDAAIPVEDQEAIHQALKAFVARARSTTPCGRDARRAPVRLLHVLVPGDWTVKRGHDLVEEIEGAICSAVANADVVVHLEPLEDPKSWEDAGLNGCRSQRAAPRPPDRAPGPVLSTPRTGTAPGSAAAGPGRWPLPGR